MYLFRQSHYANLIRQISIGIYTVLLIFELYSATIFIIFRRPPVLGQDIFLLKDAFYLLIDPSLKLWFPIILAGFLTYIIFLRVIPKLFQLLQQYFEKAHIPKQFPRIIIGTWIVVGLVQIDWGIQKQDAAMQLVSAHLGNNIVTSIKFLHGVKSTDFHRLRQQSALWQTTELSSKPDIYLIMLESYGKVMATHKNLRKNYRAKMKSFQDSLAKHGWFAATNYSVSPVSGGGSWLSSATVLAGIEINSQPLHARYVEENPGSLVNFLQAHGYTTFSLHPPDRARPGIPIKNEFGYDYQITYDSLRYQGKPYGWGLVPDQYSLYYTFDHYIQPTTPPRFLDFTTVSSHIPWRDNSIPPLVSNWRELNNIKPRSQNTTSLGDRLQNFFVRPYETKNIPVLINYDFTVFLRFISHTLQRHSLVLILGDHQPPILANGSDGKTTPLHVITDDSTLAAQFVNHGFSPGMYKAPDAGNEIRHQDIYPLLVEILTNSKPNKIKVGADSP